jgi:hypothetical protein
VVDLPRALQRMTYADTVFPALLLVMGVSIPLAVDRRVAAGDADGKAKSKTTCAGGVAVENQRPKNKPRLPTMRRGLLVPWNEQSGRYCRNYSKA